MKPEQGPAITALLPTFRRPALLRRAIGSVLTQTYRNIRLRIFDNASGDDTAGVVAEYQRADPRVTYHCHPENIGALNNFHHAIQQVDTPFFSILSDDDVLLPDFYETVLEGFEQHPEIIFAAAATIQMDENGRVVDVPVSKWTQSYLPAGAGALAMMQHGHPEWTSILFRREWIAQSGGTDIETGFHHDYDFEFRAACAHL